MDATSKYSNQKNKKIVKFNWKKATIIITIVIILLVSLGVGLYFALKPTLPTVDAKKVSYEEATQIVNDTKGTDEKVGIFFESTACNYCNYLMYGEDTEDPYGNDNIKDQDEANGSFGQYLNSPSRKMDWYLVESDSIEGASENLTNFFLQDHYYGDDEDQIEPGVSEYSNSRYIGEMRNDNPETFAAESEDNDNVIFNITVDDSGSGKGIVEAENVVLDDSESTDDTETETPSSFPFGVPFLMWFQGGKLMFFSSGAVIDGAEDGEAATVNTFLQLETDEAFEILAPRVD